VKNVTADDAGEFTCQVSGQLHQEQPGVRSLPNYLASINGQLPLPSLQGIALVIRYLHRSHLQATHDTKVYSKEYFFDIIYDTICVLSKFFDRGYTDSSINYAKKVLQHWPLRSRQSADGFA
jgi:hypothetical protein